MASPNGVDSSQELLDAQAHIWNHLFSYINSLSLKCALQLGIPNIIHKHGKPMTLSQLAHALGVSTGKSHGLYRLMRILVHSNIFHKVIKTSENDNEDAYSLTRASRLLLRDDPHSLAPWALLMTDPLMIDPFHHMSEWFRDECSSPFVTTNGMDFWGFAGNNEKFNQLFNEALASDAWFAGSILTNECKHLFEGLKTMVDVAGGTGAVAKMITGAFPGLDCVVLDLPHVVAGLEGSHNLRFVGGDMFEFIPSADAVFLKWILHDWSDEHCIKILEKCKEATISSKNNSGKVIIVDMVVDGEKQQHKQTETQLFFDMLMMASVTGKERTEKEWAKLFVVSGFKNYKITPILGLRSVIEVFP